MNIKSITTVAATLLISINSAHAVPTIDTTGSWDGISGPVPFGEIDTATYGQTFTVGTETVLNNFTFYLDDFINPDFVDFEAYVMAWDGAKATGGALFQSAPLSTTNNGGSDGFEAFTINTGGLSLTSGSQYVAFFSASNLFDGLTGTSRMGGISSDVYSGGNFVFMNNSNNFGLLTANNWDQWSNFDTAFKMEFSSAPEPTILALMGLGLAGISFSKRKKK